ADQRDYGYEKAKNQRNPRSATSTLTMELKKAISESEGTMKTYGALQETNRSRDK
ncbi:hypothetical protein M9458_012798, partial [Cirrhinus mrigala]